MINRNQKKKNLKPLKGSVKSSLLDTQPVEGATKRNLLLLIFLSFIKIVKLHTIYRKEKWNERLTHDAFKLLTKWRQEGCIFSISWSNTGNNLIQKLLINSEQSNCFIFKVRSGAWISPIIWSCRFSHGLWSITRLLRSGWMVGPPPPPSPPPHGRASSARGSYTPIIPPVCRCGCQWTGRAGRIIASLNDCYSAVCCYRPLIWSHYIYQRGARAPGGSTPQVHKLLFLQERKK